LPADTSVHTLSFDEVLARQAEGAVVIDARDNEAFASGHLRGSINVGLGGRFAEYAGEVMTPDTPIILVTPPGHESEAKVRLARIGFDRVVGALDQPTGQFLAHPEHVERLSRLTADTLVERIAALPKVDAIYASPLERARETAAPIGKALGQKVQIDRGLLECDFGDWTGAELKALMKLPEWGTVQRAPSTFRFPNGESFTEMQTRIVSAIDRLRARHPGGVVVMVSHADPIKAAVAHALGTHIDLFQRIVISTCSISAIAYGPGAPVVLTVNSTGGSLAELRPS
jgi:probable phosphoglycerate mutase